MKTALVTGASGGIGEGIAKKLASENWNLILVGRDKNKLNKLTSKLNDAKFFVVDLSRTKEVDDFVEKVTQTTRSLSLIVNAAGVGIYKDLEDLTDQDWQTTMSLNTTAPFLLTKKLLPRLQGPDPLVLNIGSGAGVIPMKGRSAYCASKFALRGLTLSLAEEFKDKSPNFCLITLGSTLTSFGGKSVNEKETARDHGKAYFPVEWVADKLVEIINDPKRKTEYKLYPSEYGFGELKKP